jgi:ribose/xylose/arabinose/galactoside ABC-type transport system permease subunit
VLSVIFTILNPNFIKINNLTNVIRQMSVLSIAAVGVTLCMLVGGIDLSIGSIMAFVSVFLQPTSYVLVLFLVSLSV